MAVYPLGEFRIFTDFSKESRIDMAPVVANRERAVISSAYQFGLRYGCAKSNPCGGVGCNTEHRRQRYVTDARFLAALESPPVPMQDVIAIGLLTGARQGDLRTIRRDDLRPEGIFIPENKTHHTTDRRRMVLWSDALRFLVRRALERQEAIVARAADPRRHRRKRERSEFVLTNKFGEPWTEDAIQSASKRMARESWHLHDLRRKAASDAGHNTLGDGAQMIWLVRRTAEGSSPA